MDETPAKTPTQFNLIEALPMHPLFVTVGFKAGACVCYLKCKLYKGINDRVCT